MFPIVFELTFGIIMICVAVLAVALTAGLLHIVITEGLGGDDE